MCLRWYQKRGGLFHTFKALHPSFQAHERQGGSSTLVSWGLGECSNDDGKFLARDPVMFVGTRFGSDGHANRRSVTSFFIHAKALEAGCRPATPIRQRHDPQHESLEPERRPRWLSVFDGPHPIVASEAPGTT